MTRREASRGQPLLVLALILGAWLVGRVLLWAPPFPIPPVPPLAKTQGGVAGPASPAQPAPSSGLAAKADWRVPAAPAALLSETSRFFIRPPVANLPARLEWPAIDIVEPVDVPATPTPARRAAGHQMLLAAAFASRELPPELVRDIPGGERSAFNPAPSRGAVADRPLLGPGGDSRAARPRRLTGDAWLLWREGSPAAVAPAVSTYGRSQAGAVLRYRLLPGHSLVPAAYARVTRTLEGPRQGEAAAGLSLRPLPGVPVELAAEARVTETANGRELRPAAFAVTQLPPVALPQGLRGEAYLQAGYVGGHFETAFVDGQARIDRRITRRGHDDELRAGLAAWGGAQKGAARLDVGPTASVALKLGGTPSRISVDYRLRIAGGASPASGPAVTFSAGF